MPSWLAGVLIWWAILLIIVAFGVTLMMFSGSGGDASNSMSGSFMLFITFMLLPMSIVFTPVAAVIGWGVIAINDNEKEGQCQKILSA